MSKYFMYSHRFIDVYRVLDTEVEGSGVSEVAHHDKYRVAQWFTRRFKSHRGIPSEIVCNELLQEARRKLEINK